MTRSTRKTSAFSERGRQHGAVLFVSLVVLVVMTLVGLTAMQGTGLDERMAGNLRDRTLAFEAAEAALREAGELIDAPDFAPTRVATAPTPTLTELQTSGVQIDQSGDTGQELLRIGVSQPPRYLIEETAVVLPGGGVESSILATREGAEHYYAVTALGYGSTSQARVVLQSILARRF